MNENFEITTNNVVLDCNNYAITNPGASFGIYLNYKSGVTVKNCDVSGFNYGIRARYSNNNLFTGNDIHNNGYGIDLDISSNNQILGNNIQLAQMLGLRKVKEFDVGYVGELRQDMDPETLSKAIERLLNTKCQNLFHGKNLIHSVAIISGFGGRDVEPAAKVADCFLTGETMYGMEATTKELKTNVIAAGHYETEILGLKALMKFLSRKTDLDLEFLDLSN